MAVVNCCASRFDRISNHVLFDKDAPRVAVVNLEFARRLFGSAANAAGRCFKTPDGTRIQVVGIVEDGEYASLTEAPTPVMFLPILQSPSSCHVNVLPVSKEVPAARKYSGEILKIVAFAAAFDAADLWFHR